MRPITDGGSTVRYAKLIVALIAAALPVLAGADWQLVASEQGKRVEIDRSSIVNSGGGEAGKETTATGRIVLDKSIVDPRTSSAYRVIEVMNRYNCAERTYSTLKRSYFREDGGLVRQEEVRAPFDLPVRSGTPDDKLLREVCRPKSGAPSLALASKTAEKVNAAAGALRRENLLCSTQAFISSRRNQMARPHLSGGLPAVKTICSSARMRRTSCGWINGRAANCFDRVRDDPFICELRLTWSISAVVMPQRREM